MPLVVDDLVFVADGGGQIFENEVLDAAVAGLRDPPLPGQLELLEGRRRDDVARALRVLAVVGRQRQESGFDLPPTFPRRPDACTRASRRGCARRTAASSPSCCSWAVS